MVVLVNAESKHDFEQWLKPRPRGYRCIYFLENSHWKHWEKLLLKLHQKFSVTYCFTQSYEFISFASKVLEDLSYIRIFPDLHITEYSPLILKTALELHLEIR